MENNNPSFLRRNCKSEKKKNLIEKGRNITDNIKGTLMQN